MAQRKNSFQTMKLKSTHPLDDHKQLRKKRFQELVLHVPECG